VVGWHRSERERALTLRFSCVACQRRVDTLVTAFSVVTSSQGVAGQQREIFVSGCVAGIEWALGTVIS